MSIRKPYLLFLGEVEIKSYAKTAFGIRDWAHQDCLAQMRLPDCSIDLGLPEMDAAAAAAAGAGSLLIGVAPVGGQIPRTWVTTLLEAAENGLDIVSGLHTRLEDVPGLSEIARRRHVSLVNVRTPPRELPIGNGAKRTGKRVLTVGTDCSLGKKYTALKLSETMCNMGLSADFRATGQTGIMIAGAGIPIDAVVADFISGAAEFLSPDAAFDHWDVIEGQGSLLHPGYAGVTLGLLHGSQPDAIVLCHDPSRTHIADAPHIEIPPLPIVVEKYLDAARLTNPAVRLAGVSLNTSGMSPPERKTLLNNIVRELGVPCFDPMQSAATAVVEHLISL